MVLKKNSITDTTWIYAKLFVLKSDTAIADWDMPLTKKNL